MITPRRLTLDYTAWSDPVWTPTRPEFSCAANSVSLMMPVIEPYFVRSARRAVPLLPPEFAPTAEEYIEQEANHFRQHLEYNQLLTTRYPGLSGTERIMARMYRRLERSRSVAFSAAFAAASETMAYSAARWAAQHRRELFTNAHDVPASLFLWHLAEEVEHKSVAHDIHRHVTAAEDRPLWSRFRYLTAMILALALVVAFVVWGTTVMLYGERRLHYPIAWFRLIRWSVGFAFELLTNLTLSVLPGFHPEDLTDPLFYEVWLAEFDPTSGTIPMWSDVSQESG